MMITDGVPLAARRARYFDMDLTGILSETYMGKRKATDLNCFEVTCNDGKLVKMEGHRGDPRMMAVALP